MDGYHAAVVAAHSLHNVFVAARGCPVLVIVQYANVISYRVVNLLFDDFFVDTTVVQSNAVSRIAYFVMSQILMNL